MSAKQKPSWWQFGGTYVSIGSLMVELRRNPNATKIYALRSVCILVLITAAFVTASVAYIRFNAAQQKLFTSRFSSVSDAALKQVIDSSGRMNIGIQELSSIYGHTFPDAEEWPNVAWNGFTPTVSLLGKGSSIQGLAVFPIVKPEQATNFSEFLLNYYETGDPYCDKKTFIRDQFSNGTIWWADFSVFPTDNYPDRFGNTTDSPHQILTPMSQYTFSSLAGPQLAAYNVHSNPLYTEAIDYVIDCAAAHNYSFGFDSCATISLFNSVPLRTAAEPDPVTEDMVGVLVQPIFPINNQSVLVGLAAGTISWKALLTNVIPKDVSGVDCVIESDIGAFTFHICNGIPRFVGVGDLHDEHYSRYRKSGSLLSGHMSITRSATYTLSFYPTHEMQESFESTQPTQAAIIMLSIFAFCCLLLAMYDRLTRREFDRNQAVLDTKRRFVRFISHEIRTPLNTVRLGMKLLEVEMGKFSGKLSKTSAQDLASLMRAALRSWKQLAEEIVESSEAAVEVLNDLLNYDKIEIGTMKLEFSYFDVRELLEKTTAAMQVQAQEKNINLELNCSWLRSFGALSGDSGDGEQVDIRGEDRTVIGDSARMSQVVRNLISNALKFTPSNGQVSVSVSTSDMSEVLPEKVRAASPLFQTMLAAGTVRIAVKDSGAGLSPQQLAEICAEGVQFNANELQAGQGSGLGLFISKGIVEQHGGKLVVASEGLGKGVTFTVELPLFRYNWHYKGHRESLRSMHSKGSIDSSTPSENNAVVLFGHTESQESYGGEISTSPSSSKRLLVVDDSVFNRKMAVRLLESQDHVCEQAEDGEKAVRKYLEMVERGEPPDAILMDFEMPVMNGPSATARLRELGCACLIVGVTGNVLSQDVAFFKEKGADAVLPKPLVLEDFQQVLVCFRHNTDSPAPLRESVKDTPHSRSGSWKVHPSENV